MTRYFSNVIYRAGKTTHGAPFGLRSVGHARLRPGHNETARVVDFAHLIWTIAGTGYMEKFRHEHPIPPGYIGIYLPGMKHRIYAGKHFWEYRWVTIDGLYAHELINGFGLPVKPFRAGKCPKEMFSRLTREVQKISPAEQINATATLYELLVCVAQKNAVSTMPGEETDFISCAKPVFEKMADNPTAGVRQIADKMGVNRSVLSRKFKAELGVSPKEYLDSLRLRLVLTLLKDTTLPLEQVAGQAGFASANYMAKYFRKKMGVTPTGFRSRLF